MSRIFNTLYEGIIYTPEGKLKRKKLTSGETLHISRRQQHKCNLCKSYDVDELCDIDHIIPLHLGGTNELDNYQILCPICHKDKTRKEMVEWRAREREKLVGIPREKDVKSRFYKNSSRQTVSDNSSNSSITSEPSLISKKERVRKRKAQFLDLEESCEKAQRKKKKKMKPKEEEEWRIDMDAFFEHFRFKPQSGINYT